VRKKRAGTRWGIEEGADWRGNKAVIDRYIYIVYAETVGILIIVGIIIAIVIIIKIAGAFSENSDLRNSLNNYKSRYLETYNKLESLQKEYNDLKKREITQNDWLIKQEKIRNDILTEIENNLSEREKAYKWLSPLIADAQLILKEQSRDTSELVKNRRNLETMARVDSLMREKKILLEENAVLKYQIEYIKTLIPEVEDIVEYDEYLNDSLEDDSPKNFLSKEEYNLLSDTEKNIRALEYYKKRKKRNWEIGRDFERYIGYLYEKENFQVEYVGIDMKFNDMGRDLIVKDRSVTTIIQCKYWSKHKIIHEKHIAQLFGTVTKYKIDNPHENNVIGLFVSHTVLSEEAKNFAKALEINVKENVELGEYPIIKCNISANGEKIYHLPMDQQYDTTIIEPQKGEFFAFTVEEAEEKGFRRAYKWHGN